VNIDIERGAPRFNRGGQCDEALRRDRDQAMGMDSDTKQGGRQSFPDLARSPWGVGDRGVLELGGSDAMIVLDDADIDHAVRGAMMGRLLIGGQVCVGDKRLVIADALYDQFVAKLTATVEALNPGDPMDPDTTFAPLSSQGAADEVKAQIAEAVAHGAAATEIGKPVPAGRSRSSSRRSSPD
jgi:acyl-CoA reductase-like NAD-dependent aldehyde dehydrogenase